MTAPLASQPDLPDPDAASSTDPELQPAPAPPTLSAQVTVGHAEAYATIVGVQQGYTADEVRDLLEAAITAARQDQAPLAAPPTIDELDAHYKTVVKALVDGRVVPFLGTDVNLCGRPDGGEWRVNHYLPTGRELAEYLASSYGYPETNNRQDLLRVAQYVVMMNGSGRLYDDLRELYDADYSPTPLHQLLAMVPELLRAKGYPRTHQLIVTTNYDDLMERTLQSAGESFDVVSYVTDDRRHTGSFVHWPYGSEPLEIEKPNEYRDLPIEDSSLGGNLTRSIVLKLHGAVDRSGAQQDSFVITEDHYIDYLAQQGVSGIPRNLEVKLQRSHFLFLGYGLRDWNVRGILQRIWSSQKHSYNSWAVQATTEALDQKFWSDRDVDFTSVRLEDYVAQLAARLSNLPLRS